MELSARTRLNRPEYRRLRAYGWLWAVFAAALAVAFVFTALFAAVRVADAGMAPVIAQNDIILFSRLSRFIKAPARGDMLAFFIQKGGPAYVGRAVGLPGETVTIFEGRMYIDGVLLDESAYVTGACPDLPATSVPEGCYFILPDARAFANVENPEALLLNARNIIGTASVRVFPFPRVCLFK